jgi:hypothetical protein
MAELERWARQLPKDLTRVQREIPEYLEDEAQRLAATTRRFAPRQSGALRASILARGLQIAALPYAEIQSTGGRIRSQKHGWLTIPVRPGYSPGTGYVTVRGRDGNQYVLRSGTVQLWAVRRREVLIRGTRYLERALSVHLERAGERVGQRLVDEVT